MADAQIIITVDEMASDCESKIKHALERINGVERVVNWKTRRFL